MSKKECSQTKKKEIIRIKEIVYIVFNIAFLVLSANIAISLFLPITLQIFMIFFIIFTYSKKISLVSIFMYVILGLIGLPFFSGLKGGISILLTYNGGFILSFLFIPVFNILLKNKIIFVATSLIFMYVFAFIYFIVILGNYNLVKYAILTVSLPYMALDIVKIVIAYFISKKILNIYNKKYIDEY